MLTDQMKVEIIDYVLPLGSFCKGIIEDESECSIAYEEGTINSDDIYKFIAELRAASFQRYGLKDPQRKGTD